MIEDDRIEFKDLSFFNYQQDDDIDFLHSITISDINEISSENYLLDNLSDKQLSTRNKTSHSIQMLKRKRNLDDSSAIKHSLSKRTAKEYRELNKAKFNELLAIKQKLLIDIENIHFNPIEVLIHTLPQSLMNYESVLFPKDHDISFTNKAKAIEYVEYLQDINHSLVEVYKFKWIKNDQLSKEEIEKEEKMKTEDYKTYEQFQLFKYILTLIPFVDNMRRYYCFISKFK